MRRRRNPAERRVVLRRCETADEAEVWADAYRSVLASLDVAAWWRVRIDPAEAGALNVGYQPACRAVIAPDSRLSAGRRRPVSCAVMRASQSGLD